MKTLLVIVLVSSSLMFFINMKSKKNRMDLAEHVYELGCLTEATNACPRLTSVFDQQDCYEDSLVNCSNWSKRYRKALEEYKP